MTLLEKESVEAKVGLLQLAKRFGNVSRACKAAGCSRNTFYRYKRLHAAGGQAALQAVSRRKPVFKNRFPESIEREIVRLALRKPMWGQLRASRELEKRSIVTSPAGIRGVWLRHDLNTVKKRLLAKETRPDYEPTRP